MKENIVHPLFSRHFNYWIQSIRELRLTWSCMERNRVSMGFVPSLSLQAYYNITIFDWEDYSRMQWVCERDL